MDGLTDIPWQRHFIDCKYFIEGEFCVRCAASHQFLQPEYATWMFRIFHVQIVSLFFRLLHLPVNWNWLSEFNNAFYSHNHAGYHAFSYRDRMKVRMTDNIERMPFCKCSQRTDMTMNVRESIARRCSNNVFYSVSVQAELLVSYNVVWMQMKGPNNHSHTVSTNANLFRCITFEMSCGKPNLTFCVKYMSQWLSIPLSTRSTYPLQMIG